MKGILGFVLVCIIVISLHVYSDNNPNVDKSRENTNTTAQQSTVNSTTNTSANDNTSTDSKSTSASSTDSDSYITTGKRITLKRDTPVCSSKANVDKMISYLQNKNDAGVSGMERRGEATMLPSGTKVNIVKFGMVTEMETDSGERWFAPYEVIK